MKKFSSKSELFRHLVTNKAELIAIKKSATKFTDIVAISPFVPFEKDDVAIKAKYPYENDEEKGVLKRTIVANTYNWLDSHGDVHLSGIFSESIKQKGTKVFHLKSHIQDWDAKVGK